MRSRYGVRGGLALAVAGGALAVLPAPVASAGTITLVGGNLTITGDAAGETVVTTFNRDTDTVTYSGITGALPAGCAGAGTVTCTGVTGTYALNTAGGADTVTATGVIDIDLGPGNDTVSFADNESAEIDGGDGNDTLVATTGRASFGSQTTGGPGNDVLRGGPWVDSFDGEPGADLYSGGGSPAAGQVGVLVPFGGPVVDSFFYPSGAAINVTLDGVANDGPAGELDNIGNDITFIGGSNFNDRLDISGAAFGGALAGSEGNDVLIGSNHADLLLDGEGADDLRGGAGNDRLGSGGSLFGEFYPDSDTPSAPAADRFDGGEGDDRLGLGIIQVTQPSPEGIGTYGADVFIGGPGSDTVVADVRSCDYEPYTCAGGTQHNIAISLDDVANDGAPGINQGINVRSDIESIESGGGNDTLLGSAVANTISGGAGNDTINPLGGADAVLGGAGVDAITSRDGMADAVDCGIGVDAGVVGDTTDALVGCEGANNLVWAPGTPDSAPVVTTRRTVKLKADKLVKTRAITLSVSVDDVSLLLASATTSRLMAAKVLLGEAALRPAAGRRTVVIKLSEKLAKRVAAKARRSRKGLAISVKLVAVNGSGVATTKRVTVKVVR